jgi:hypothetical protein
VRHKLTVTIALLLLVAAPIPFLMAIAADAWVDGLGTWYVIGAMLPLYMISSSIITATTPRRRRRRRGPTGRMGQSRDRWQFQIPTGLPQGRHHPGYHTPLFPMNPPLIPAPHRQLDLDRWPLNGNSGLHEASVPLGSHFERRHDSWASCNRG